MCSIGHLCTLKKSKGKKAGILYLFGLDNGQREERCFLCTFFLHVSAVSLEAMHTKRSICKMLIHLQAQYT